MTKCDCGNPKLGFTCVCDHIEDFPGDKIFSCEKCGSYNSSKPRCSKCEDVTND